MVSAYEVSNGNITWVQMQSQNKKITCIMKSKLEIRNTNQKVTVCNWKLAQFQNCPTTLCTCRCQHGHHTPSWAESWSSHCRPSISVGRLRVVLGQAKSTNRPLPRTLDSFLPHLFFLALLIEVVSIEPNDPTARRGNQSLSASDLKAVSGENLSRRMVDGGGGHGEQK
jgi:hypothetical protein